MSTPNFYSRSGQLNGTNTVYAVSYPSREDIIESFRINSEDEDNFDESTVTDEDIDNESNFLSEIYANDAQENVFSELQGIKKLDVTTADEYDDERSYGGHIFGEVTKRVHSEVLYVEVKLIIRSGYYAYANLDFDYKVYSTYSGEYYDLEEVDKDLVAEELQGYNDRKPTQRQVDAVYRNIHNDAQELDEIIRKVYSNYTQPLARVGIFSNGEAVYETIK